MLRFVRDLLFLGVKKQSSWKSHSLFRRKVPGFGRQLEILEGRRMLSVTLGPGDIAFTGFQSDDPDTFSFVLLKTVDSSTALSFTDNGWSTAQNGFANTGENTLTVTFNSNYSAGTQLVFQNGATPAFKTVVGGTNAGSTTGSMSGLSTSGDSILAYQGSAPTTGSATNWVAGINANSGWQTNPANSNESDLPTALVNGTTAIAFSSNKDDGALNLTSVTGTVAQIRALVNDISKWTLSDTAGGTATVPPTVTFTISGSNSAPTGLSLSSTSIAENNAANAAVGTFTTTDPDSGNTFTYSLVTGTGSTDNGSFNINGNSLRATSGFDYETKNSYSIRVRTTDQGGLTFEQTFAITVTDVNEATSVLLNEIKANPPGNTAAGDKYQYVELRGAAGAALTNVYLVMLDGNGSDVGIASYVIGLTGKSLGSNGLLMIKSPTAGHSAAAGTTVVTDSKFDSVSGGVLSKHTVSFYVVSATSAVVEGTDYDTNDDGVLDHLPAGFTVLDNVGWSDGDSGDVVYGGVSLTQNQGTPDAATRFPSNNLTEVAAWFNGDLYDVTNDPSQLLYDSTRHSTNLPLSPSVAALTPGDVNFTEPPVITTNSGLSVTAGTTANVIADSRLKATDAEQSAAQLTFTITALPASGTLKYNNAAVVANVTTFTQADITANKLTYDAPSTAGTASFSFSVSDGTQATTGTFALTIQASTDTTLRFVDYNIASSGGTGDPRTGFNTLLQAFSQESYNGVIAQVDLFVFQEVKSQATTSQFIVDELNGIYGTGVYGRGTLDGFTSGAGTQGVVYNTHTLQLVSEATVGVSGGASRQTMRYLFHPIGGTTTSDFYVYDSHLKASEGSAESAQRLEEVQAIRADADALGQGVNIVYAGDFNLYTSTEDAYQEFLSAGNGQAFDPINRPGSWHNNSTFVGIDTQAPAVSPPAGLTSGGLDDRFDFQLISGELTNGQGLEYLTGSYHTFGNNGSIALNQSINGAGSTALPNLANRTTVLDLLTTVTDHLPVVADYTFTVSATNTAPTAVAFTNTTTSIAENTAIGTNLKVADITVTDDGLGTNALSLSGTDQSFFTIVGTSLYLKAGTSLNFETKSSYNVTVNVDDTTVGSTPDVSASFTLNVTNVNEAPTAVAFTNTTTSIAENTAIGTNLKVADITVTDDALGTNTLSLSGTDQSFFTIIGTSLYLKAGTSLDFETKGSYAVTVNVDDTTVGSTPDASASFTLNVTNVNEAPTAVAFTNTTTSLAENTTIGVDLKVADITVTDDALGTNTLSLSGADQAVFKIIGTSLYLKAGTSLDFETKTTYAVMVGVDDTTVGSTPDASTSFTLNVTNVNEAPTVVLFTNTTTSVAENTAIGVDLKVADINVTDDALGTNTLTLGGADQAVFKIIGSSLYLKAGTSLDFETRGAYAVTVNVDDTTVGSTPDASASFTLTVTNLNEAPTAVGFANTTSSLAENATIGVDLKVADINVTDDVLGTNTLSLSGADQAAFKIVGTTLYLKAGTSLNFESKSSYAVTVNVDDTTVGSTPDASAGFTLNVTNVNEAPTAVTFTNTTTSLAENTAIGTNLKVADINVTDDALGTNALSLSGTDQNFFTIIGTSLYLKAGTGLNFETKSTYAVTVNVDDATVGSTPDASASFTLNVTNVNEPPTAVAFTNTTTSLAENTAVPTDLKVADINITDDALGTNTLSLSGADQAFFRIIGTGLYLKAGTSLNFEAKASYAVTVNADDTTVGSTPDATAGFTLTLTDLNDNAPVITTSASQSVAEGTTQVAVLVSTDADTVGTNPATFSITGGADMGLFQIAGSNLLFNSAKDYEIDAHQYVVEVTAFDGVNSTARTITVTLTDVNDNAPVISTSASQSVAEGMTQVALLTSTDLDSVGINPATFTITGGADMSLFGIDGGNLVFNSPRDFETDAHSFDVEVTAFDGVNNTSLTINVTLTDVDEATNQAPTGVGFTNATTSLAENTAIGTDLKVATIDVTDDGLGSNILTLSGADQAAFKIIGTSLYLKAGTSLDFETKSSYAFTVNVDDTTLGGTPDASTSFTLNVTNVNEIPSVALTNTTTSLAENTAIPADLQVADINITDDALGTNTLFLSGADQDFFKIIGTSLYLKVGTSLDFETRSAYTVAVNVDDASVGSVPDASVSFSLNITDVNDAPTAISFINATTSIAENTAVPTDLKVADINVTDDVLGTNALALSGADQNLFKIIGSSLYLKAGTTLNFESRPSYSIIVGVDDTTVGSAPDASASFTLSVTDVNEAPTLIAVANTTTNLAENTTISTDLKVADISVTDDALGTNILSLTGADQAAFKIIGTSLYLKSGSSLDFESKSSYTVTLNVDDASAGSTPDAITTFTLNVTNANDAPSAIAFANTTTSIAENTAVPADLKVADINVTDDVLGTNTLSLNGADQGVFKIIGTGLYLKAGVSLDFETKSNYTVTVNVDDTTVGGTADALATFALAITNVNEAPTAVAFTNTTTSLAENAALPGNLKVADISITDDALGANTLSLTGADQNFFTVIGTSLYLKAGTSLNFEAKSIYAVTVNADDTTIGNSPDAVGNFTLNVTNVNEAPTTIGLANTISSLTENTPINADLKVADINVADDALGINTLSLSGADLASFKIIGTSLYLKAGTNLNFEAKASYTVTVNVDDTSVGGTPDASTNLTLNITNLDEAAPTVTSGGTAAAINENSGASQVIYTATAIDTGDISSGPITFSLGGADAGAFSINSSTGAVTLTTNPNFEVRPSYNFTVTATDTAGNASAAKPVTLAINNLDEVAPTITSGSVAAAINENSSAGQVIYTVTASDSGDISAAPVTFGLGGADAGAFSINSTTGAVTLAGNPNFEAKANYSFTVTATDAAGNASAVKTVTLAINNVDEAAPTMTSGATATTINENSGAGQTIYIATATDAGDISATPIMFTLGGPNAAAFSINGSTGVVTLKANPNFEAQANYSFTVTATDAANNASAARTVTLAIANLDEVAPTITSSTTAAAINENSGAGQVVYTVTATDAGDISSGPITYNLGGPNAGSFSINVSTGVVTLTTNPNFEARSAYTFTVTATDAAGNASAVKTVTLAINNLDEVAPAITSGTTAAAIDDNSGAGQVIYVATASDSGDISAQPITFSLSGLDAAAFSINGSTGALTLTANPDFQTKSSYSFTVTATDAAGNASVPNTVTLAINSTNSAPTAVSFSNTTINIAENTVIGSDLKVAEINVTDDAQGTNTLSLSGTDQNFFRIIGTGLYLKAGTSLNFEARSSYSVMVNVDDATVGGSPDATANFTLHVIDLNEAAPAFTTAADFHVAENLLAIGTVVATDADVPVQTVTYRISGGVDAGAVSISSTGALTFNVAPDYEHPADSDGNQVYDVQITADDGAGLSTTQAITITVADVNEPPQLAVGGPAVTWIKKQPAVTVLPALTVGDSTTPGGGTLTIQMAANGSRKKARDLLTTPATGALGTSAGMQFSNGTLTLQIDLGPNVTGAAVQSFLRGIKFLTKGAGLKVTTRTIHVTLSNSHGESSSVSQTINVLKKA